MKRLVQSELPSKWGSFKLIAYENSVETMPHLALVSGDKVGTEDATLVRVHSECMTGDVFGSHRCDCGEQLEISLQLIREKGGVLIYLRQEGRGIGLVNKLKAYNLQDEGLNTADANVHLGFEIDERDYKIALDILADLNISKIHLLTNNPQKIEAFEGSNIEVVSRIPLIVKPNNDNAEYLSAKRDIMGHLLKGTR
ncbi:MAG: GTP cyclohydrolase II [Bacteroidia bacterium]|nr:GTP cyclohydrolase II [Bacteroidia bacterium]